MESTTPPPPNPAAIATLQIYDDNKSILQNDWIMNMICHYIQQHSLNQLTIQHTNPKHGTTTTGTTIIPPPPLQLIMGNDDPNKNHHSMILTERNTILRSLLGMVLHNTMDHYMLW